MLVIDPETGTLTLAGGRIDRGTTRSAFRASPVAQGCRWEDMRTGWTQAVLSTQAAGPRTFTVRVLFECEQLDGYRLCAVDPRYGASWDEWSEEKERARSDAHDALLIDLLGPGARRQRPDGSELTYAFPWGDVWSAYDARSGGSEIGVRFLR